MNKKVLSIVAIIALVAILTVCLVACNADTYKDKLEDEDYVVAVLSDEDIEKFEEEYDVEYDIKWAVSGTKGLNSVTVLKFKKIADAKDFVEDISDSVGKLFTVERTSSYVFVGTSDAVDIVK